MFLVRLDPRRLYFVPTFSMEALTIMGRRVRWFLQTVYARPKAKPRLREPFHLGIWFDVLVVAICILAAVAYLAA